MSGLFEHALAGRARLPRLSRLVSVGLVLWFLISPGSAQPTAVELHGPLRVQGNRILDRHGDPAVLRGMSFFWSQWMGQYYQRDTVRWLRDDWHCTVVRAAMGVDHDGYLAHPEREKERVKAVVQAAIDLGIYVIVDWHDHDANQHLGPAREFFGELAQTYGWHPNLIYELWNEPLKNHDWSTVIKPYHEAVIAAIRHHDPDNLIICGTPSWSQDVDKAALDPVRGTNIAYTLHFYAATHKQRLRDKASAALASGIALMVTEWGTSEASGAGKLDDEETRRWLDFMGQNRLSWCNWSVAAKQETSAALKPGAKVNGGWSTNDLTPSGWLVREQLRALNPPPPASGK